MEWNLTYSPHLLGIFRAEIVRKREKYERDNMGGYMRIYPSDDPKLQVWMMRSGEAVATIVLL